MSKVIVCIKGVPVPGATKVDPETHTLKRESLELILNPNDKSALEMAIRLKETYNFKVVVISMGPPNVIPLLKYAYALGCDEMILLSDKAFAGSDTLATSLILAKTIQKLSPYSVILTGLKSIDGETAQVPPEIGALLGVPSLTNVKKLLKENDYWIAIRENEYGEEELEVSEPFVASINPHVFDYLKPPSLKRLLEVEKKEPTVFTISDLDLDPQQVGLNGSLTQVIEVFEKKIETKGTIIEGNPQELINKLIEILKTKDVI